ncbi:MAG TPA: prolyl oligopeptidase family serine peptidase [Alphaproteobacteria bacterium]|nr:prolyl oligopeptidase family serine peptidase [Alphaproteobacteria bacterium]
MTAAEPMLSGPAFGPVSKGPARQLVVLLHGVGADGNDLIGLAPHLAEVLPHAAFISPNAPERYDMAPFGYQWFTLMDRRPEALDQGVRKAAPVLDAFLDAELEKFQLDDGALALVAFSQGTMTALYTALRRPKPCAAVVGYSGALLGVENLASEIKSRPPVLLIHGDQDPVVPFAALAHAAAALAANGVPVEHHARPGLGHGIDGPGLALGARFLIRAFGVQEP